MANKSNGGFKVLQSPVNLFKNRCVLYRLMRCQIIDIPWN